MSDRHLSSLEPDVSSLLEQERAVPDAPPEARERVYGRVAVTIGAGLLAAGAGAAASAPATISAASTATAAAPAAWGGARLAMSLLVGAAMGSGLLYALTRHPGGEARPASSPTAIAAPTIVAQAAPAAPPATPPSLIAQPAPSPGAQPSSLPAPLPVAALGAARHHRTHPATPSTPGAGSASEASQASGDGSDLSAERRLLDDARAALAMGNFRGTWAALHQHEVHFAHGQLVDARESLHVRALAAEGKNAEARSVGLAFRRRFPTSIFAPAVDATLQSLPPSPSVH